MNKHKEPVITAKCSKCNQFTDFCVNDEDTSPSCCSLTGFMHYLVLGTPLNPAVFPVLGVTGPMRWFVRIALWWLFIMLVAIPLGMVLFSTVEAWKQSRIVAHTLRQYNMALEYNDTDAIAYLQEARDYVRNFTYSDEFKATIRERVYMSQNEAVEHVVWFWLFCLAVRWIWWFLARTFGLLIWTSMSVHQKRDMAWWFWRTEMIRHVRERYIGTQSVITPE